MNDLIGIIAAMDSEIAAIKDNMTDKITETVSGIDFVRGSFSGKAVVVAKCGIGKVFAAICAQTMILKYSPRLVINTGVGGTLTDKLGIGDIAVACDVVQHDMDTSPLGDPVGLVSGINVVRFPADLRAVELICRAADDLSVNNVKGTIASGDQFIASREKKADIVEKFGAIACEMEGAAIGHVCYVNATPFAVVRAISDSADDSSHMDYGEFLKIAAERSFKVVTRFVGEY
jgi:adenosylhomocysteine nucleosidase